MKRASANAWKRLNIAQAIVVVAALAGVVCMVIWAPPIFWEHIDRVDWKFWLGLLLAASGVSSPFLDRLIRRHDDTSAAPPPRSSTTDEDED